MIFHDAHEQRILGKVSERSSKYESIDRNGYYKHFIEAADGLITALEKDVDNIKKKSHGNVAALLVEKAFIDAVIPNPGFLGFSNIRSGVTDNVWEKFYSLYQRYVDDIADAEPVQEEKPAPEVKSNIIDLFLDNLREAPHPASFPYAATGGKYLFDTSFIDQYHVFLKTVRVHPKKKGTVEWGNVLQSLVVLSDLKVIHPNYTFGILLDFLYKDLKDDRVKRALETIASLTARFKQANVDLVLADRKEVEHYLMIKGLLLKKHRQK